MSNNHFAILLLYIQPAEQMITSDTILFFFSYGEQYLTQVVMINVQLIFFEVIFWSIQNSTR